VYVSDKQLFVYTLTAPGFIITHENTCHSGQYFDLSSRHIYGKVDWHIA